MTIEFKVMVILLLINNLLNLFIKVFPRKKIKKDDSEFAYCPRCRRFLTFDSLHAEHINNHIRKEEVSSDDT